MMLRGLLLAFLFLLARPVVQAQGISDWELRQRVGLSYRPNDRLTFNGKFIMLNQQDFGTFRYSCPGLEVNYKINGWLKLGAEYRFITSYQRDVQRYWLFAMLDYHYKKWEIDWRALYQTDVEYFDAEFIAGNPLKRYVRNLVLVGYNMNRKWKMYGYTEAYQHLHDGRATYHQQVYALGVGYTYKRRHTFNVEGLYSYQPTSKWRQRVGRASINYSCVIGKVKKKKKKHKHRDDGTTTQPEPVQPYQ